MEDVLYERRAELMCLTRNWKRRKKKPAHWRHPCIERKLNTLFFVLFFQCVAFLFHDLFRSETVFCFKWIIQVERTRVSLFVVVLLVDALFLYFFTYLWKRKIVHAHVYTICGSVVSIINASRVLFLFWMARKGIEGVSQSNDGATALEGYWIPHASHSRIGLSSINQPNFRRSV